MELTRKTISDAGMALAVLRRYQNLPLEHPEKPIFAAALASFTAESMGGKLHVFSDDKSTPFTLLVSEWTESSAPSAVLINNSISDWTAAVSLWCITNQNLFRKSENFADLENINCFIMRSTYELWTMTPKGSPVRWAEAARVFDDSGLADKEHACIDESDSKEWNSSLNNLKPRLLNILGYNSVSEIVPDFSDEPFPTQFLQEVLIAENNNRNPIRMATMCVAKPLPTHIPIEVLVNRGDLSPAQALAFYLVDEEYGPKLTYATAANLLGMKNRQEIGTHLKRARDIFQKSGQKPELSGYVRYEYIAEEAPKPLEVNISARN